MKILITNDDGIHSEGILALARMFEKEHEVFIVAPNVQRSAAGHSITIDRPIIVKEVNINGTTAKAFSTDGTPADCIKLGVEKVCHGNVDFIVSGINHGTNLGSDVIYSGTVSAAIEGVICRIPSFAVSLDIRTDTYDYMLAAKYARKIILHAIDKKLSKDIVLNINVPGLSQTEIKGIRVSALGNRIYQNSYLETKQEDNSLGYKIEGFPKDEKVIGTDTFDIAEGYVTVTPLHYDLTNYKILSKVNEWFKEEV